jgi:hypothetical protein
MVKEQTKRKRRKRRKSRGANPMFWRFFEDDAHLDVRGGGGGGGAT